MGKKKPTAAYFIPVRSNKNIAACRNMICGQ